MWCPEAVHNAIGRASVGHIMRAPETVHVPSCMQHSTQKPARTLAFRGFFACMGCNRPQVRLSTYCNSTWGDFGDLRVQDSASQGKRPMSQKI